MTFRIDRNLVSAEEAVALNDAAVQSAVRRQRNLDAKACINENKRGEHGPATHGCRCYYCHLVHKHGGVKVAQLGISIGDQP